MNKIFLALAMTLLMLSGFSAFAQTQGQTDDGQINDNDLNDQTDDDFFTDEETDTTDEALTYVYFTVDNAEIILNDIDPNFETDEDDIANATVEEIELLHEDGTWHTLISTQLPIDVTLDHSDQDELNEEDNTFGTTNDNTANTQDTTGDTTDGTLVQEQELAPVNLPDGEFTRIRVTFSDMILTNDDARETEDEVQDVFSPDTVFEAPISIFGERLSIIQLRLDAMNSLQNVEEEYVFLPTLSIETLVDMSDTTDELPGELLFTQAVYGMRSDGSVEEGMEDDVRIIRTTRTDTTGTFGTETDENRNAGATRATGNTFADTNDVTLIIETEGDNNPLEVAGTDVESVVVSIDDIQLLRENGQWDSILSNGVSFDLLGSEEFVTTETLTTQDHDRIRVIFESVFVSETDQAGDRNRAYMPSIIFEAPIAVDDVNSDIRLTFHADDVLTNDLNRGLDSYTYIPTITIDSGNGVETVTMTRRTMNRNPIVTPNERTTGNTFGTFDDDNADIDDVGAEDDTGIDNAGEDGTDGTDDTDDGTVNTGAGNAGTA